MELDIAVAKVNKYATSESGDTLEVVERPGGGVSVVLADGQRSGKAAKRISNLVVRKVIALLAEGIRDGAAARAASDYLYHERHGKVLATLNILSADLHTKTLVITRNNPAPVYLIHDAKIECWDEECVPVGIYRDTRPLIREIDLETGLTVVVFTDGITHAGDKYGTPMNIQSCLETILKSSPQNPEEIAESLLQEALRLDNYRPSDDISVVVLQVCDYTGEPVRRMKIRLPYGP